MADFPENGVTVFEFFELFQSFSESFNLGEAQKALEDALEPIDTHPGSRSPMPDDVRRRVLQVKEARRGLAALLSHPAVTGEVPRLKDAYEKMYAREFGAALGLLARITNHADLPAIRAATVAAAYAGPISYTAYIPGPPDREGERTAVPVTRVVCRGYEGPKIPAAGLVALSGFMKAGADRKRLLDSECRHGAGGARNLVQAIHQYTELLPQAVVDTRFRVLGVSLRLFRGYAERHTGTHQLVSVAGMCATWTRPGARQITPTQQFVALRSAFAHLALGDLLLRRHRVIAAADRHLLAGVYAAAVRLVVDSGISPRNAARGQVEAHAARQRTKLASGLNALGLHDGFVPPLRYSTLKAEVKDAIDDAEAAARDAVSYLDSAENKIGQLIALAQEQQYERDSAAIYQKKVEVAWLEESKADEQVELVQDQRDALGLQTAAGIFSAIAGAIDPKSGGFNPLTAFAGIASAGVNFMARSTELKHQLEMARIDVDIAGVQREIALAEVFLSQRRQEYLAQKLQFEANRRVNPDMLLFLADMYEKRAARLLEAATVRAYLAERALAFAKGIEIAPTIRLDYWDNPGSIPDPENVDSITRLAAAVDSLRTDFRRLVDPVLQDNDQTDLFQEHLSLRNHYPLEFARLLQDGEMYFEYSMYQLSKRFPRAYKCRLYDQAVEVHGLGPPGGARGSLEHAGAFLLRQKDLRQASRLLPTDEDLAEALRQQRAEGRGVASVGGMLYYVLPPEARLSTLKSALIAARAPDDLDPEQLRDGLEGYGPTGLWRLKIDNLDELRIGDVTLHFGVVAGVGNLAFETRIEELVRAYETELAPDGEPLDRVSAFSLRQQFPDAFEGLRGGATTVELSRGDFPSGLENLRFKALVTQALDVDGWGVAGVRLRYGRQDAGFSRERVTVRGGFSEDLDGDVEVLPPPARFGVDGAWQVELLDPQQFALLDNLVLFVMYSFQ